MVFKITVLEDINLVNIERNISVSIANLEMIPRLLRRWYGGNRGGCLGTNTEIPHRVSSTNVYDSNRPQRRG
jgi:hypothetical protein